ICPTGLIEVASGSAHFRENAVTDAPGGRPWGWTAYHAEAARAGAAVADGPPAPVQAAGAVDEPPAPGRASLEAPGGEVAAALPAAAPPGPDEAAVRPASPPRPDGAAVRPASGSAAPRGPSALAGALGVGLPAVAGPWPGAAGCWPVPG